MNPQSSMAKILFYFDNNRTINHAAKITELFPTKYMHTLTVHKHAQELVQTHKNTRTSTHNLPPPTHRHQCTDLVGPVAYGAGLLAGLAAGRVEGQGARPGVDPGVVPGAACEARTPGDPLASWEAARTSGERPAEDLSGKEKETPCECCFCSSAKSFKGSPRARWDFVCAATTISLHMHEYCTHERAVENKRNCQ